MIYVGYPCIGKSSIAGKDNFIDLESSFYKELGKDDWVNLYVNVAIDLSNQGYHVLLSSHHEIRDELRKRHMPFKVIVPDIKLYYQWLYRAYNRLTMNVLENRNQYNSTEKKLKAFNRICLHWKNDIVDLMSEENVIIIDSNYYFKKELPKKSHFDLAEFIKLKEYNSVNNTIRNIDLFDCLLDDIQ